MVDRQPSAMVGLLKQDPVLTPLLAQLGPSHPKEPHKLEEFIKTFFLFLQGLYHSWRFGGTGKDPQLGDTEPSFPVCASWHCLPSPSEALKETACCGAGSSSSGVICHPCHTYHPWSRSHLSSCKSEGNSRPV